MRSFCWGLIALCGVAAAQTTELQPVNYFPLNQQGLAIRRHVEAAKPFTVAGTRGIVVGQQDGQFEAWVLPVKLLSHFSIEANVEGYTVPIDVNQAASEIEVYPDHTIITYSHIAFTVRQIMFAPDDAEDGTGAVVLFQIDSIRPVDFTFRFTPEMRPMWPERSEGDPVAEWVKRGASGFYVLHTDYPGPGRRRRHARRAARHPGPLSGEAARSIRCELKLHYDPKRDGDRYFPLLMAEGTTTATATTNALLAKLTALDTNLRQTYEAHAARYAQMLSQLTSIQHPRRRTRTTTSNGRRCRSSSSAPAPATRSAWSPATTPPATPRAPASAGSSAATRSTPSTRSTATATSR